jgi:hypothetical protein
MSILDPINLKVVTKLMWKYSLFNGHQPVKFCPSVRPVCVCNVVCGNVDFFKNINYNLSATIKYINIFCLLVQTFSYNEIMLQTILACYL